MMASITQLAKVHADTFKRIETQRMRQPHAAPAQQQPAQPPVPPSLPPQPSSAAAPQDSMWARRSAEPSAAAAAAASGAPQQPHWGAPLPPRPTAAAPAGAPPRPHSALRPSVLADLDSLDHQIRQRVAAHERASSADPRYRSPAPGGAGGAGSGAFAAVAGGSGASIGIAGIPPSIRLPGDVMGLVSAHKKRNATMAAVPAAAAAREMGEIEAQINKRIRAATSAGGAAPAR